MFQNESILASGTPAWQAVRTHFLQQKRDLAQSRKGAKSYEFNSCFLGALAAWRESILGSAIPGDEETRLCENQRNLRFNAWELTRAIVSTLDELKADAADDTLPNSDN